MKEVVGIIGVKGDLGSQLAIRLEKRGFCVRGYSRSLESNLSVEDIMDECSIVHVCAPLKAIEEITPRASTVVILHDSVMYSSKVASETYLGGSAAIVHMLMNDTDTVVVASDAPYSEVVSAHLRAAGLSPMSRTISEHDHLIARSQAPLALLCKVLLPYLYEQADQGMLTPSGQLLANTLRSRESVWTNATMHSILKNPELQILINDMNHILNKDQI